MQSHIFFSSGDVTIDNPKEPIRVFSTIVPESFMRVENVEKLLFKTAPMRLEIKDVSFGGYTLRVTILWLDEEASSPESKWSE